MTTGDTMPTLDDISRVQSIDSRNVLRLINEIPEHCETALAIGRSFRVDPLAIKPNVVLFVGVGESGFAADLAAEILSDDAEVAVQSQHVASMPACVGEHSIVFVIDYTGNTRTAVRAYKAARERGARTICVTTGGLLRETAEDQSSALSIPAGQPARFAVGYMVLAPVAAVQRMGLTMNSDPRSSAAVRLLKNAREFLRFEIPAARNEAKKLAELLHGNMPVILGASDYRRLVARRWVSQLGSNAKHPAVAASLNDLVDGEICAWEQVDSEACKPAFVFLVDELDWTTESQTIRQAAAEVLSHFTVAEAEMKGANPIERLFYGMFLGDYVSYYLALLREVDPYRTATASLISQRLALSETSSTIAAADTISQNQES